MNWKPLTEPPETPGWYLGWTPYAAGGPRFCTIRYYGGGEWGNIVGCTHWAEVIGPDPSEIPPNPHK